MRKPRFTYKGAFHHIMARGYEGHFIFGSPLYKDYLLGLISEEKNKYRIRIFAYCIMDNHYHLVLENSSGRLSQFMRAINGRFAQKYRLNEGGKGYVFQDRYKSTLIEDETYLKMAITYVVLNPIRSGLVESPYSYIWSSGREYFHQGKNSISDAEFVSELFGSEKIFLSMLEDWADKKLPENKTQLGFVLGSDKFYTDALKKYDRRKNAGKRRWLRKEDYDFPDAETIINEFENNYGIRIEKIDTSHLAGKKLRGELLALLKDYGGLTYKEIKQISIFQKLSLNSLGGIYKNYKHRK